MLSKDKLSKIENLKCYDKIHIETLKKHGFSKYYINILIKDKKLKRLGHGIYEVVSRQYLPSYNNFRQMEYPEFLQIVYDFLKLNRILKHKKIVLYLLRIITPVNYYQIIQYIEEMAYGDFSKYTNDIWQYFINNLNLNSISMAVNWLNVVKESIKLNYLKKDISEVNIVIKEWANKYLNKFYETLNNNVEEAKQILDIILQANKEGLINTYQANKAVLYYQEVADDKKRILN